MATILLIEDSESQRTQLREAVGRSGLFARVVEARDRPEALGVLQSDCIDIVLCDLDAPGLDETLIQMRDAACGRCCAPETSSRRFSESRSCARSAIAPRSPF